jgi:hypothetical protein
VIFFLLQQSIPLRAREKVTTVCWITNDNGSIRTRLDLHKKKHNTAVSRQAASSTQPWLVSSQPASQPASHRNTKYYIDTYVGRACNAGWKVTSIVWITFHENASWTLKEVGGTHGGTIGKLTIIGRISVRVRNEDA